MRSSEFIQCSLNTPCRICHKTDWCSESTNGQYSLCRRVQRPDAHVKYDKHSSPYYVYQNFKVVEKTTTLMTKPPRTLDNSKYNFELLNDIYSDLLANLELSKEHFIDLTDRGFDEFTINRNQYKSLPRTNRLKLVDNLMQKYSEIEILSCPGFFKKSNRVLLAGSEGLLIPIRNLHRQIVALKIRRNVFTSGEPKYVYLSSKSKGFKAALPEVHLPLFDSVKSNVVRVTEGELKADLATSKTKILTISIPGVGMWEKSFEVLYKLDAKNVKVAFDQDFKTNHHVANHLKNFVTVLHTSNFIPEVETWN